MEVCLDMIGIDVREMEASLRFYRMLGLEIPAPEGDGDYVETTTPNGYRVSWNTVSLVKSLDPSWVEPVGHRMGLAFKCTSPAAVNALYAKLVREGYRGHKEPWDAFWGQRYAIIDDPDGNHVSLFAPLKEG
jgi:catechol 2,3-dioxygenase-like lactoylglutathione lyase family enzyme